MERYFPKAQSPLITTGKGLTYHLQLDAEHIADIVIITDNPENAMLLSKYFDKLEFKIKNGPYQCYSGFIGKKNILVIGIVPGTAGIDIVMHELDMLASINNKTLSILRIGNCTSLTADVATGSHTVSACGIGLDNLMAYYRSDNNADERFILEQFMQHTRMDSTVIQPYVAEGAISLRKYFTTNYISGITVTLPGFYTGTSSTRGQAVFPYLTDALATFTARDMAVACIDTETAAFYGLGRMLGHHCCSLGMVVYNHATRSVAKDAAQNMELMIKHTLSLVEQIR